MRNVSTQYRLWNAESLCPSVHRETSQGQYLTQYSPHTSDNSEVVTLDTCQYTNWGHSPRLDVDLFVLRIFTLWMRSVNESTHC